jgi:hypothetical protein
MIQYKRKEKDQEKRKKGKLLDKRNRILREKTGRIRSFIYFINFRRIDDTF